MQYPYISAAGYFSSDVLGFRKGTVTPTRILDEYVIELFVDDYKTGKINDETVPYQKNTLMILRPGDVRCSVLPFSCYYIHVSVYDAPLREAINLFPRCQIVRDVEKYIPIFQKIAALYPQSSDRPSFQLISCLYALLALVESEQQSEPNPVTLTGEDAISIAKVYLNEHMNERITLNTIAEHVHLSPNYFHTMFTRSCGLSPLAYLTQLRMAKARRYLVTTAKSVSEIADLCGFETSNYFCSRFKKYYGVTPVAFRKENGLYRL